MKVAVVAMENSVLAVLIWLKSWRMSDFEKSTRAARTLACGLVRDPTYAHTIPEPLHVKRFTCTLTRY